MTTKTKPNQVSAQPLDSQSYSPYGTVVAAETGIPPVSANMGTAKRFNHLGQLENLRAADATPNLCVFRSTPFQSPNFEVRLLERHLHSTQLFIPMGCEKRYLVVVCQGADQPDLTTLRAFIAHKDQGVTYHPGVWHHPLIALDQATDFACVVWEDGTSQDCEVHKLDTSVMVELSPAASSPAQNFLAAWHSAVERKDLGMLDTWVTEDVVLNSPALFRQKQGKKPVSDILRDVLASLDGYHVTRTWIDGNELLLEFDATVNGMNLQGVDRITLNNQGQMTRLKVFIRPFKGLQALISAVVELNIARMSGPRKLVARLTFALKSRL